MPAAAAAPRRPRSAALLLCWDGSCAYSYYRLIHIPQSHGSQSDQISQIRVTIQITAGCSAAGRPPCGLG
eukprot:SAG25_NODE_1359_length_3206_cov_1.691664_1_plen_70_part_00